MHVIVAITGASGGIYAQRLLDYLNQSPKISKISVVMSRNADGICREEIGGINLGGKAVLYADNDYNAPFASGSNFGDAMVVCPCSMGTLGRIAGGVSDSLITRAADVALKERRRLVLVVRETPYNLIHIRNMETVTLSGGIICPATPSFYSKPSNVEEVVNTVVFRILDLMGVENDGRRWGSDSVE
ncbi:MAG: UbiX family flavin prenyltransferase [Bacteroidales bacterium]|nr:UbiX family flavin prenyltransferase [Bacteroidales bacterium]